MKKKIENPPLEPLPLSMPLIEPQYTKLEADIRHFTDLGGSPIPGLTLRRILQNHSDTINRIAWSPDGRRLASPSSDNTICIWDIEHGKCLAVFDKHKHEVSSVTWSPDGHRLASGSADRTICIWDVAPHTSVKTWKLLAVLKSHWEQVNTVAWSPDGHRLASGSSDNNIFIWDTHSWKLVDEFKGHENYVLSLAWSPDGYRLASSSSDNTIRIWNLLNHEEELRLVGHSSKVSSVIWHPHEPLLASGAGDNTIRIWDTQSGRLIKVLEGHLNRILNLSFSFDGALLASQSDDSTIRLWRTTTWELAALLTEEKPDAWPLGIAFHPHLPRLATLGQQHTAVRIWDLDMRILFSSQAVTESVKYITAKLVLVGDSGVGKTGLGWRLAHGQFKEHSSTHGQQFWIVDQLSVKRKDGTECEAVLWDLAGQHIYRSIHAIFLHDVDLALVLFDPTNRQEPLKGVEFWLEQLGGKQQLPPTVLVGARVDRGAPVFSQSELSQFCQKYGVSGGYVNTSAKEGYGLDQLLSVLQTEIPWEQMTTTVTTVTFKRIKEYVLELKEKPNRRGVLVHPPMLRQELQETDLEWQFSDAEMMTAVKHLETHGYVALVHSSSGNEFILLVPELLVDLASSIVLQADKHPRELGALSESTLLQGEYPFLELASLERMEGQILLDSAIVRFLAHNICFRETLGSEALLIFPSLIKQKRPLFDTVETVEDVSYIVRGRVENVYAALVVLLGYTQTFTRVNQWQNQAQYELGADEVCGFRLIEEREGEIELVLYYSPAMPAYGRIMFQGLFEKFLYQRDIDVTRFPPVVCLNNHRQERSTVVKRIREGKIFLFCEECGDKINLPGIEKPLAIGEEDSRWVRREAALARLRSAYEAYLVRIKGFRRDRVGPRCYISHDSGQADWVARLSADLRDADVYILKDKADIQNEDFVISICTPIYKAEWNRGLSG